MKSRSNEILEAIRNAVSSSSSGKKETKNLKGISKEKFSERLEGCKYMVLEVDRQSNLLRRNLTLFIQAIESLPEEEIGALEKVLGTIEGIVVALEKKITNSNERIRKAITSSNVKTREPLSQESERFPGYEQWKQNDED